MYRHILVGLDENPGAQQAFATALELARLHGATLTLLSVEEHLPHYAASIGEVMETDAELSERFRQVQAAAVQAAAAQGIQADTLIVAGTTAQVIARTAQAGGYDLIVIGAGQHGGLWSSLLGSTADRVVDLAPCSVLVVRQSPLNMWAGEVMQREVLTVRPETPIATVVELLVERGVKAVPVLDQAGKIVGIITGGDLLQRADLPFRLSLQRQISPSMVRDQLTALTESGRVASDVMTADVITIDERTPLREAARLMAQRQIKRLPVVDARGQLCGILSRADVLRHIAAVAAVPSPTPDEHELPAAARYVSDILDPNVPTVTPEAGLDEVVGKVVGTPLRRVVVIDPQRHVTGIITDADLIGQLDESSSTSLLHVLRNRIPFWGDDTGAQQALAHLRAHRAQDVMRPNPVVIAANAPIVAAIQVMMQHSIKRLPVVDQQDRLVGIVDRQAIVRALTHMS
jgi:CBS domain-containing protein/nucleotide-binding universal stress UspA family protein